jgi:hypothetical protein
MKNCTIEHEKETFAFGWIEGRKSKGRKSKGAFDELKVCAKDSGLSLPQKPLNTTRPDSVGDGKGEDLSKG